MKRLNILFIFSLILTGACLDLFDEEPIAPKGELKIIRALDMLALDPIKDVLVQIEHCCEVTRDNKCLSYCKKESKLTNEAGIVKTQSIHWITKMSHNSYAYYVDCLENQNYKNSDGITDYCFYRKANLKISIKGDMNNDTTSFVWIFAYYTNSKSSDVGFHYVLGYPVPTANFLATLVSPNGGSSSGPQKNLDVQKDLIEYKDGIGDYYLNVRVEYYTKEMDFGVGRRTHIKEFPPVFTPSNQLTEFSIQL